MNRYIFAKLRDALADLYSDSSSIERIIHDSGINRFPIDLNSGLQDIWHSVLTEAEKSGRVSDLLDVVERQYGRNSKSGINPAFQEACDAYRQAASEAERHPNTDQDSDKHLLSTAPSHPFSLDLSPKLQRSVKQAAFTIEVHNQGNADLTVQLGVTDSEKECDYTFDPPQLTVPADQRGSERLTISTARHTIWKTKVHRFKVTVRTINANQHTQETEGEWHQLPPKGPRIIQIALLALVVGLFVNYLTYRFLCFAYSFDWYYFDIAACTERFGNVHLMAAGAALLVMFIGIMQIIRLWHSTELIE